MARDPGPLRPSSRAEPAPPGSPPVRRSRSQRPPAVNSSPGVPPEPLPRSPAAPQPHPAGPSLPPTQHPTPNTQHPTPIALPSREEIFAALAGDDRDWLVDSPPGAGKTTLVAAVAAYRAAGRGQRVLVTAATNSAVDEVCRKLLGFAVAPPLFRVSRRTPAIDDPRLLRAGSLPYAEFHHPHVAAVTLAKLAYLAEDAQGAYDVCLVDEVYLVPWRDLAPALLVGRQQILIGDPGQLPPVVPVETRDWDDMPDAPHLPAPVALQWQRSQPDSPRAPLERLRLPTTFRLRPDTAALVQRHFYPEHPFTADPAVAAERAGRERALAPCVVRHGRSFPVRPPHQHHPAPEM